MKRQKAFSTFPGSEFLLSSIFLLVALFTSLFTLQTSQDNSRTPSKLLQTVLSFLSSSHRTPPRTHLKILAPTMQTQVLLLFYVLLVIAIGSVNTNADQSIAVNGASVQFLGHSGKMKFCPTATCEEKFLQISMNKLHELDASGDDAGNAVPSFASQDFGIHLQCRSHCHSPQYITATISKAITD